MRLDGILSTPELVDAIARALEQEAASDPHQPLHPDALREAAAAIQGGKEAALSPVQEAIVRKQGRPTFFIRDAKIAGPLGEFWGPRIEKAQRRLEAVIPAVGRVDLERDPRWDWNGTAWLVTPDVAVTNRHVAREFAAENEGVITFAFDPLGLRQIGCSVDFRHEHQREGDNAFEVTRVLHIEPDGLGRPDVAVLQLAPRGSRDQEPPGFIRLAQVEPAARALIASIGYPGKDLRGGQEELEQQLFGGVYDVKRLMPGEVMETASPRYLNHDCSTLTGCSGSVLIDFEHGLAVGLHYAGDFGQSNYAVKASTLAEVLHKVGIHQPPAGG